MNTIREFPVTVYGNLTKYSETISKARVRVFYKYENRNGTYITDEFAEKLLSTIAYAPVKGIYDQYNEDYTDHGDSRTEGRIYGIVPENYNLAWERHLDEDGVEREYACVDVLIFTALYKEANEIVGKAQSMEIYESSMKGSWKYINGKRLYEFTDGCFLGLQVLGEDVEPCFEGAAFFSKYNSIEGIKDFLKELFSLNETDNNIGGQSKMAEINFKLSDSQKHDALWSLLNTNYNEESGWIVEYAICDIYDDYALAFNYAEGNYERIYYTKNDETDSVEIMEKKTVYVIDVTESELSALNTIRTLNGGTYELVDETYAKVAELEEQNSTYEQKVEELNISVSTLETEKEQFTTQLEEANNTIASLTEEIDGLNSYKENVEKKEKEDVIASYAELLSEEILETYTAKIGEFSAQDLDKELAYELKKNNVSVFTQKLDAGYVPKDQGSRGGIEQILAKYKK